MKDARVWTRIIVGSKPGGLRMSARTSDGDILEPLPVHDDGTGVEPELVWLPALAVPQLRAQGQVWSSGPGQLSAAFTRIIDVHPVRLRDLDSWWQRGGGHG